MRFKGYTYDKCSRGDFYWTSPVPISKKPRAMINNTQHSTVCTSRDHTDRSLYSVQAKAELEMLDRQIGREYLPMDVFVGPEEEKKHFHISSIRARRT